MNEFAECRALGLVFLDDVVKNNVLPKKYRDRVITCKKYAEKDDERDDEYEKLSSVRALVDDVSDITAINHGLTLVIPREKWDRLRGLLGQPSPPNAQKLCPKCEHELETAICHEREDELGYPICYEDGKGGTPPPNAKVIQPEAFPSARDPTRASNTSLQGNAEDGKGGEPEPGVIDLAKVIEEVKEIKEPRDEPVIKIYGGEPVDITMMLKGHDLLIKENARLRSQLGQGDGIKEIPPEERDYKMTFIERGTEYTVNLIPREKYDRLRSELAAKSKFNDQYEKILEEANELYGKDAPEAERWLATLLDISERFYGDGSMTLVAKDYLAILEEEAAELAAKDDLYKAAQLGWDELEAERDELKNDHEYMAGMWKRSEEVLAEYKERLQAKREYCKKVEAERDKYKEENKRMLEGSPIRKEVMEKAAKWDEHEPIIQKQLTMDRKLKDLEAKHAPRLQALDRIIAERGTWIKDTQRPAEISNSDYIEAIGEILAPFLREKEVKDDAD